MIIFLHKKILMSRYIPVSDSLGFLLNVSWDRLSYIFYRNRPFIQSSWYSSSVDKDKKDKDMIVNQFFKSFLAELKDHLNEKKSTKDDDALKAREIKCCGASIYQESVFNILEANKGKLPLSAEELTDLQYEIESLTTLFDDRKNRFQISSDLLSLIISKDKESAKEFLLKKDLTKNDVTLLMNLEHYTIEIIMVYILGLLFNSTKQSPAVRVSTLVENLSRYVINHALMMKDRNERVSTLKKAGNVASKESSNKATINDRFDPQSSYKEDLNLDREHKLRAYNLGTFLVEFLVIRGLIILSSDLGLSEIYVNKKKGKYYIPKKLFAICNFNISLLPVKLNLPMVCKPAEWRARNNLKKPCSISDLQGGYLNTPVGELYFQRYSMLSSRDYDHFNIQLFDDYYNLCDIMNKLQMQAFEINTDQLNFLNLNYELLVEEGLFMPKFLASVNIVEVVEYLREYYLRNKSKAKYSYQEVYLKEFFKRIQRARYEVFILKMASAYEGYQFYLPTFLDFRGRIYRAGNLHFHERDLARSLIVFSNIPYKYKTYDINHNLIPIKVYLAAIGFHYKKFKTDIESFLWVDSNLGIEKMKENSLIKFAVDAKEPFQFLGKSIKISLITTSYRMKDFFQIPITQDASASAYQIMSYLLLDTKLAVHTNLIPSSYYEDEIKDIYTYVKNVLQDYISKKKSASTLQNVCMSFSRKLVKSLFMPLIYGKSLISMSNDIYLEYSNILNQKECMYLAKNINDFFKILFPGVVNLMELVRAISWMSSYLNKPVYYETALLRTIQDYLKSEDVSFTVYDRFHKKRRKVSMRIPTTKRDRRKTFNSTFANFIHQKDAYIAALLIIDVIDNKPHIPIYSVHDNFITTAPYTKEISDSYIKVLSECFNPLYYINNFIIINLRLQDSLINQQGLIKIGDLKYELDKMMEFVDKKDRKAWKSKIETVIKTYEYYVNNTCKITNENGKNEYVYNEKLEDFRNQMRKWYELNYNYSLHL